MPPVCKFFLKGYCRYGRNCRFEHPGENTPASGFSFTKALEDTTITNSSPLQKGFSFTKALESTTNFSDSNFIGVVPSKNVHFSTPIFGGSPPENINFTGFSFAGQANQVTSFNNSASFFKPYETTLQQPSNLFNADDIDMRAPLEVIEEQVELKLTEAELKAFQSEKFQFRLIPVRPPPDSLCR